MDENDVDDYIDNKISERFKKLKENDSISDVSISEIQKVANAGKSLKEAFQSPFEQTLVSVVGTKFLENIVPAMSQAPRSSSSFLDSGFAIALAQKFGEGIPAIVDVLFNRLGADKTEKLITDVKDGFINTRNQNKQSNVNIDQSSNDIILSLEPDNPAHLHQYMSMRKIEDPKAAKKNLILEKEAIFSEMKNGKSTNTIDNQNNNYTLTLERSIESQNTMLKELTKLIQEDRQVISGLYVEVQNLKVAKEQTNVIRDNRVPLDVLVPDKPLSKSESKHEPESDVNDIPESDIENISDLDNKESEDDDKLVMSVSTKKPIKNPVFA